MTSEQADYAIRMERYGGPEVLVQASMTSGPPGPRDLCLRTLVSAVNHTDLRIRAGDWPIRKDRPFPYVPGVETLGVVVAAGDALAADWVGQTVITMMQGLGGVRAERPGGYATGTKVAADAVARVPSDVDPFAIAALGLAGVTAFHGLRRLGDLRGRDILVTGAAGGVGSAAVSIAHAAGARVTALVRRPGQAEYVRGLGAEQVVVAPGNVSHSMPPQSVDGVLDTVGGEGFNASVRALRPGGSLCLVGAADDAAVSFEPWGLIRPTTLTGYSTETLTGEDLREAIAVLCEGLASGEIRPPTWQVLPLSQAAEAHRRLEAGGVNGRLLLVP